MFQTKGGGGSQRLLNNELQKWYCAASQILNWKIWNIIQIVYEKGGSKKIKKDNKKFWWRLPLDIWHVFLVILICAMIIIISGIYGTIICCLLCSPLLVLALWKGQKTRGGRTCPLPPYSYTYLPNTIYHTFFTLHKIHFRYIMHDFAKYWMCIGALDDVSLLEWRLKRKYKTQTKTT